jgi:hypothetical protein
MMTSIDVEIAVRGFVSEVIADICQSFHDNNQERRRYAIGGFLAIERKTRERCQEIYVIQAGAIEILAFFSE